MLNMRDDQLSWYWRWRKLYGYSLGSARVRTDSDYPSSIPDRFGANPFRRDEATEEPETEEAALAGKNRESYLVESFLCPESAQFNSRIKSPN